MVSTPPKYTVETSDDGGLSIQRTDGEACTDEERDFVAGAITAALRARSFAEVRQPVHKRSEGMTKGRVPFEVDPFVAELEEARLLVPGLSKRQLSKELGWYPAKLGDVTRGITRIHMDEFRDWAALSGLSMTPMLIPAALVKMVKQAKELFNKDGTVVELNIPKESKQD